MAREPAEAERKTKEKEKHHRKKLRKNRRVIQAEINPHWLIICAEWDAAVETWKAEC